MKCTNGYWRIREEMEPVYAVEYYDAEVKNKELTVYAATKHMGDRGDTLNQPLLTIRELHSLPHFCAAFAAWHCRGPVHSKFADAALTQTCFSKTYVRFSQIPEAGIMAPLPPLSHRPDRASA